MILIKYKGWDRNLKFKKKIKSRVKEFREDLGLTQQQLAENIGVSRQTIYYLEKGDYNPSLTLSFNLSKLFDKSLDTIFYQEPVIFDVLGNITIHEFNNITEETGLERERILGILNCDDTRLAKDYQHEELVKLSQALGYSFEVLFEE